jgi:hypothetical protein
MAEWFSVYCCVPGCGARFSSRSPGPDQQCSDENRHYNLARQKCADDEAAASARDHGMAPGDKGGCALIIIAGTAAGVAAARLGGLL